MTMQDMATRLRNSNAFVSYLTKRTRRLMFDHQRDNTLALRYHKTHADVRANAAMRKFQNDGDSIALMDYVIAREDGVVFDAMVRNAS